MTPSGRAARPALFFSPRRNFAEAAALNQLWKRRRPITTLNSSEGNMFRWSRLILASVLGLAVVGLPLTPVLTPAVAKADEKEKERHPHIHKALEELREARKDLKEADHDFGGHRAEAVEAIDVAIKQLELALKFDKK
jgi:hypothetical protein